MPECLYCGKSFTEKQQQSRRGHGAFCSYACGYWMRQGISPESLHRDRDLWRQPGGKYLTSNGYVAVYVGKADTSSGYQLEHRLVMSQHLGRPLESWEHVHHKDGNRQNNDLSNLELLTNTEHQRLHNWPITQSKKVPVICAWPGCGIVKMVKLSRSHGEHYCGNEHKLMRAHQKAAEFHAQQRALKPLAVKPIKVVPPNEPKPCKRCGTLFKRRWASETAKAEYCSRTCALRDITEAREADYVPPEPKMCRWCAQSYLPRFKAEEIASQYCSRAHWQADTVVRWHGEGNPQRKVG
jgi:hypothetical protein